MACVRGCFLLLLFVHCAVSQQNHCGEPTKYLDKRLDDRYLHKTHFTDGNRVAYSCLPGYTRTMGSRMSFCKNGRWTALNMTCDKKKCNPLTELENGQYRQNGLLFGDEAFAVCNDGYVLKGEKVRLCEEMGRSGQDPICVPQYSGSVKDKTCSKLSIEPNGTVEVLKSDHGQEYEIIITCQTGFNGSGVYKCNGERWEPAEPKCSIVKCPVINISNGKPSIRRHRYGSVVVIRCDTGFRPDGAQQIRCDADGSWKPAVPQCVPVSVIRCSPPAVLNGEIISGKNQHYNPRDTVTISCAEGFNLIGSSQITCGTDGQWKRLPECRHQVRCSAPSVRNGRIISEEQQHYNPRDHVTVSCTEGFDLIGSSQITCGADGQWQDLPECRQEISETGNCGRAPIYDFAYPRDEYPHKREYVPGDRLRYKCVVGYRWSGGRDTIYCKNGRWTKLELNCDRKKCGTTGEIFHGHVRYSGISFGDFATVICDEGYEPTGPVVRYCRDGGWEGRNAECEPVYCPPPPVSNADTYDLTDEHVPFGHVVSYRCGTGTLIGEREIHCTKNGSWSAPPPECKDVTCPVPRLTHGSRLLGYRSVYKFRQIEKITCKPGYKLANDDYVTCGIDGKWKPELSKMCVAENKKNWFY